MSVFLVLWGHRFQSSAWVLVGYISRCEGGKRNWLWGRKGTPVCLAWPVPSVQILRDWQPHHPTAIGIPLSIAFLLLTGCVAPALICICMHCVTRANLQATWEGRWVRILFWLIEQWLGIANAESRKMTWYWHCLRQSSETYCGASIDH